MTLADIKQIERAMANFNTCDHAGANLIIEVDKLKGTKKFNGFCGHYNDRIEVEPICRKCLRHAKKKKKKYKKTATQRKRISQGRVRQRQRKLEGARYKPYNPFIEKDRDKDTTTKHDI